MILYLSKPKNTDKDVLEKILEHLSEFDVEVSYYEESDGPYSHKKIDLADVVLVVPSSFAKPFNYNFMVSKGVYSEIDYNFDQIVLGFDQIVLGIICIGDELFVSPIIDFDVDDPDDWKKNYGTVYCYENMKPLNEIHKFEDFDLPRIKRINRKREEPVNPGNRISGKKPVPILAVSLSIL